MLRVYSGNKIIYLIKCCQGPYRFVCKVGFRLDEKLLRQFNYGSIGAACMSRSTALGAKPGYNLDDHVDLVW